MDQDSLNAFCKTSVIYSFGYLLNLYLQRSHFLHNFTLFLSILPSLWFPFPPGIIPFPHPIPKIALCEWMCSCVFSKILRYILDSGLSRFPLGVSVCTQHQRCSRTSRVQKNHNILRKNTIFNEHPVCSQIRKGYLLLYLSLCVTCHVEQDIKNVCSSFRKIHYSRLY